MSFLGLFKNELFRHGRLERRGSRNLGLFGHGFTVLIVHNGLASSLIGAATPPKTELAFFAMQQAAAAWARCCFARLTPVVIEEGLAIFASAEPAITFGLACFFVLALIAT